MWQVLLAGISLGLLSSFHCVGMCGPLALALPVQHLSRFKQVTAVLLYNTGRVITYSLMGLLFGLAGRGIHLAGFQQWFSITLGMLMLVPAFYYFIARTPLQPGWLTAFHIRIQALMGRFLQIKNMPGYTLLGMANGLLPCGMVYLAIAGALSTGQVKYAVLFMVFFGAGTLPAMLLLGILKMKINLQVRRQLKKLAPYVVAGMAVVLILRGLNLGIPFISPVLAETPVKNVSCH